MNTRLRNICFVRHAKSSWKDMSLADIDRPLNKRGKRDAPFMSKKMLELNVRPDYLLVSPAKRARATAKHFMRTFELDSSDVLIVPALYHASVDTVITTVQAAPDDKFSIFVFGHNPTFTDIANQFAGVNIDNVPTCGIFQAKSMVESWKKFSPATSAFVAFYYPKQYLK